MKLMCEKQKLLEIINTVQKAVAIKSTVGLMECIKIEANTDGHICFTGSNLELYIEYNSECDVKEGGAAAIEAKMFSELVRRMPEGIIHINIGDNNIAKISCGKTELSLSSKDVSEYPEKPVINESESFSVSQTVLRDIIRRVAYAASPNNVRPVLGGVLFDVSNSVMRAVALDNTRLALRNVSIESNAKLKFIVPQSNLKEIAKVIKDEDREISISVSDKHALFDFGEYRVTTRLIEGEFINYEAIMSKARNSISALVETQPLCESIERAALIVNDSSSKDIMPIKLLFSNNEIQINSMSSKGMIHDVVHAEITGDDIEIGFNYKYLLETVRAAETETIKISMSTPLGSCFILPTDDEESFVYIVQPVRL